jgi:hypothetical protein
MLLVRLAEVLSLVLHLIRLDVKPRPEVKSSNGTPPVALVT